MLTPENTTLSPRESILLENDKEENRLAREHAVTISRLNLEQKKLELEMKLEESVKARRHAELMRELEYDMRVVEAKWTQIFKIPLTIIKLPVYMLFAIAYIVEVIKGSEPSIEFWRFLK